MASEPCDILPFRGWSQYSVEYWADYEGSSYYVRYRHDEISITRELDREPFDEKLFEQEST